jgi:hypothetical protein
LHPVFTLFLSTNARIEARSPFITAASGIGDARQRRLRLPGDGQCCFPLSGAQPVGSVHVHRTADDDESDKPGLMRRGLSSSCPVFEGVEGKAIGRPSRPNPTSSHDTPHTVQYDTRWATSALIR